MYDKTLTQLDAQNGNKLIPLESSDPEPFDYPLDALPGILGGMAEAVTRHVQCPAAIAGQSVLGAASLAVQSMADVLVDGRRYPISLYAMTIALSGERKTSADRLVLHRHQDWEREAWAAFREDRAVYEAKLTEYKQETKKNNAKRWKTDTQNITHILPKSPEPETPQEPVPPESPQLISGDATYQGLAKAFSSGRPSQGLFSDEGGVFLGGWGMKSENLAYTISSLSGLWDGAPIRRSRGGDETIPPLFNRRLACHLLITPAVAERTLSEFMLQQGFLPRFLIARPASNIGFREYQRTDPTTDIKCIRFWDRMGDLLSKPIPRCKDGGCELRTVVLSRDAHELFIQMYNRFESSARPGADYAELSAFVSKAAENMVRIAAVFALVEDPDTSDIDIDSLAGAARLIDKYYLPEALRFVQRAPEDAVIFDAKRLLDWIKTQRTNHSITIRDVCRSGPRCARKSATVARRLIGVLVDHGYLLNLAGNSFLLTHEALTGDNGDSGDIPRG